MNATYTEQTACLPTHRSWKKKRMKKNEFGERTVAEHSCNSSPELRYMAEQDFSKL